MSSALAPGSYRPASGLGGVRALAGLGCASTCGCQQTGIGGGAMDVVKSPVFLLVAGIVIVGAVTLFWESRSG